MNDLKHKQKIIEEALEKAKELEKKAEDEPFPNEESLELDDKDFKEDAHDAEKDFEDLEEMEK